MFAAADLISLLFGESKEEMNPKQQKFPVSAHLRYETKREENVEGFQCELMVPEGKDPVGTYYCACGWHRGYMGMQVNSPWERRILFSVWDDGEGSVVETVDSHPHALVEPFGGEGEGMHAILQYRWQTGVPQKFCVTCRVEPERNATVYTGYFKIKDEWIQVASFRAPSDGTYMQNLYSFLENFGWNIVEERQCLYGNQLVKYHDSEEWMRKYDAKCTTTKVSMAEDFYGFSVEGDCFSMTINGPRGKQCQLSKPEELFVPMNC